jgi:hypothetical protein
MAIVHNEQTELTHRCPPDTKILYGKPVRFRDVCVHTIKMGDVEDPDIYVAAPIWEWQQTNAGKFVMEHAVGKPYWIQQPDYASYHLLYRIMARLSEQNETFWRLKYVDTKN